jgi:hypothetical protein
MSFKPIFAQVREDEAGNTYLVIASLGPYTVDYVVALSLRLCFSL